MKKALLSAAFAAVMLLTMVLTSCSSDSTPSGVVKSYYSCMKSGDVEKAVGYLNVDEERAGQLAASYRRMLEGGGANAELYQNGNISIESEEINGDEADVMVGIEIEGMEMGQPMHLVKVDGKWKIDE